MHSDPSNCPWTLSNFVRVTSRQITFEGVKKQIMASNNRKWADQTFYLFPPNTFHHAVTFLGLGASGDELFMKKYNHVRLCASAMKTFRQENLSSAPFERPNLYSMTNLLVFVFEQEVVFLPDTFFYDVWKSIFDTSSIRCKFSAISASEVSVFSNKRVNRKVYRPTLHWTFSVISLTFTSTRRVERQIK